MTSRNCRCSPQRTPARDSNEEDSGFLIRLVPTSNPQLQQPSQPPHRPAVTLTGEGSGRPALCPGIHFSQTTLRATLQHQQPRFPQLQEAYLQTQQYSAPPFPQNYQQNTQQPFQQPVRLQPYQPAFHIPQPVYSAPVPPYMCQPVQQRFVPQFAPQTFPLAPTMAQVTQFVPQQVGQTIYRQVPVSSIAPISVQTLPGGLSVTAIANTEKECKKAVQHSCCCLGQHNHNKATMQSANSPVINASVLPLSSHLIENLVARAINTPPPPPAGNITLRATASTGKNKAETLSSEDEEARKAKTRRKKKQKGRKKKEYSSSSSSSSSDDKKKAKSVSKKPKEDIPPSPPPEPATTVKEPVPPQTEPPLPPPKSPEAHSVTPYSGEEEHEHVIYHEEFPPDMQLRPNTVSPGGTEPLKQKETEEANPLACAIVLMVVVGCFVFCLLCVIYPSIIDSIFALPPGKGGYHISDVLLKRVQDAIRKLLPPITEPDGVDENVEYTRFRQKSCHCCSCQYGRRKCK